MIDTIFRAARPFSLVVIALLLSACLTEKQDEEQADALAITFTNPAGVEQIQTPDIVVNVTGTVEGPAEIEKVEWQNDRGGKGVANGKEKWVTGNIVLQLGANTITVTATDVHGQASSKSLTVERENTAPSADSQQIVDPVLMYSYQPDLGNAAPVKNAAILGKTAYFFIEAGPTWTSRGISKVQVMCCKGQDGPGKGETYTEFVDLTRSPWSQSFDLSGYAVGGTRRVRITATFADGSISQGKVFDFIVAASDANTNTAPIISGVPPLTATAGVQYSFRPQAQDPDGDTMQFNIANKPSWASFNTTNGRLYGTPTANDVGRHDNIIISVSDGQHTSSLPAFAIDVEAFGGGSATLSWSIPTERTDNTPLQNLAGFHIYYGQTSGDYANKVTLSNPSISNYLVDNLSGGQWFFVVTAFDANGVESNPSNEGSKVF